MEIMGDEFLVRQTSQVLLQNQACTTPVINESPLLPEDLIIDILSRLPVKTLLQFRAVCKTWKKVIGSSYFEHYHFGRESNPTDLLVCWTGAKAIPQQHTQLDYFETAGSISLLPNGTLETPIVELGEGLFNKVVCGACGPCHGILCVLFTDMVALWNPATTKLWPIRPSPPFVDVSDMDMLFSFWIDPSTNEFKIFWIVDGPRFLMYTSCNDSWKELKAPFYPGDYVTPRQCCSYSVSNGIYYFLKYNGTTHHAIIAYDIFKDLFQEIRMPKIEINSEREIKLDLHGDSLALFVYENVNFEARTEVWVMKEKGCWTKLLNVDIRVDKPCNYQPLGFWKRNEIFVYCATHVIGQTCTN